MNLIVAMTKDGGIGINNRLPIHSAQELQLFKKKTMDKVVIGGNTTIKYLPKLTHRTIYCLSRNTQLDTSEYKNNVSVCNNLRCMPLCVPYSWPKDVYIIGGGSVYDQCLNGEYKDMVDTLYISIYNKTATCDTHINIPWSEWIMIEMNKYDEFTHYIFKKKHCVVCIPSDIPYQKLLRDVLLHGEHRETRNGYTIADFDNTLKFNLQHGFPLLTTKKMFWRGIVNELLFFIRGDTDSTKLEKQRITIWKKNTSRDYLDTHDKKNYKQGMMGPMYGYQWRFFGSDYDQKTGKSVPGSKGIDQLANVIHLIKTNPTSRRIMMTTLNPAQTDQGVLPPCHSIVLQFFVQHGRLDLVCYNRSSDLFLGLPFNIASTALLHMIISNITNLIPGMFTLHLGDCHIYKQHVTAVKTQLDRFAYKMPTVKLSDLKSIQDAEKMEYSDFKLCDYNCHPSIKVDMIA